MSEVKVNKISPRSGTTVTLGDSGDTITLASGVSLTGVNATFSGDLTVDTNTLYVDSANNRVGVGTSSPATQLHVSNSLNGDTVDITIANTYYASSSTDEAVGIAGQFYQNDVSANRTAGLIRFKKSGDFASNANASGYITFSTRNAGSLSERMRIDSSGNVGIGTSSPQSELHIDQAAGQITEIRASAATVYTKIIADDVTGFSAIDFSNDLRFKDAGTERMRIDSSGDVIIGKTTASFSTKGFFFNIDPGQADFVGQQANPIRINRLTDDGVLVSLQQDGSQEGTISVSGATVAYNGFTGTHWSRLSDNSKPTILKGTILESLDEMMDWYQVQFDITETDDEGNETTITQKESYTLGNGESVGDVITYNYEGTDYQATIIQEADVKHTKAKISDTVDAKNVYGVFVDWDNDDDTVNDMYVAQTGTFVVRINSSVTTLNKGDLIQSNGDGTGKVQSDDLLRASTVAKVLSTTKIETYEDGSYIVPCSLHC